MSLSKKLGVAGLTAVIAGAGYKLCEGMHEAQNPPIYKTVEPLKLGTPMPEFKAETIDGKTINLADLENKVILLDFWATWCGPCKVLAPHVEQLYQECKEKGLEVISIATEQPAEDLRKYMQTHNLPFPVIHDTGNQIKIAYHVKALPTLVLIKSGAIRAVREGYGSASLSLLDEIRSEINK